MRFLKVSSYYRDFMSSYYQNNIDIITKSYSDQYEHLMAQYFAWSDNYGRLLAEKGFDTMEVVANAHHLQKAWNEEFDGRKSDGTKDILVKQIEHFKPEIIYFQDSITYNGAYLKQLKLKFPFIKRFIGNLCAPFSHAQLEGFREFSFFTVCSPLFQKQLNKYGIESVIIPHAFDRRILDKIGTDNNFDPCSFIFIGSIFSDKGFHSLRKDLVVDLVNDNIDLKFYGNLPDLSRVSLLKRQASYLAAHSLSKIGMQWLAEKHTLIRKGLAHQSLPQALDLPKELIKMAYPPVFGLDMFRALSKADVGFNIHIDCAGDFAANMRMFETAGVATCLITDYKKNIGDFYKEDEEVVTYKSKDECLDKVKWLINNPDECAKIAKNGQIRTLEEHNFENRVNSFYDYLKST